MAIKAATATETAEPHEEGAESPLLDTLGAAVKKMIARGRERGHVTYDELNAALPPDQVSSEQIEDTMAQLSELGISVVENEEPEEAAAEVAEEAEVAGGGNVDEDDIGRTDDPVRMYLREMGSVELLSREGEIAIAKRIEAGREMMIGGICESPLTMRAIVRWHDMLRDGKMLLRDIIDLEATYGGSIGGAEDGQGDEAGAGEEAEATAEKGEGDGVAGGGPRGEEAKVDDGEEAGISLAAMEATLKPEVIATFERIAATQKKLHRLQMLRLEAMQKGQNLSPSQEKRYARLRQDLVALMEDVRLNNARIEQLVEQLYELNRRLIGFEGRLLRLAMACKVQRADFLERYFGVELDPRWLRRVSRLKAKGWKTFATKHNADIKSIRAEIANVSAEAGLPLGEFRRIVSTVQKG